MQGKSRGFSREQGHRVSAHHARLSRSSTEPAGHEQVTDIFIHRGSSASVGIVLPSEGVLRCCVFGICLRSVCVCQRHRRARPAKVSYLVAPLCAVCPTSESSRISIG